MPGRNCLVFAVAMVLSTMGLATGARAECSPGQMQEAQIQFQSAQQLLQTQQWRQAVPQLTSIVQFCEEYFPALRGLGLAHYQLGQYAKAADAYERVIEVRGNEADAGDHANLARALAKQKKYKEARAEYIKAKTRDAKNQAVLVNLGILHAASGFPEDAVDTFQDALTYYPELADRILPQLAKAAQSAAERQKKLGNTGRAREYEEIAREVGAACDENLNYQHAQGQRAARQGGARPSRVSGGGTGPSRQIAEDGRQCRRRSKSCSSMSSLRTTSRRSSRKRRRISRPSTTG